MSYFDCLKGIINNIFRTHLYTINILTQTIIIKKKLIKKGFEELLTIF